MSGFYAWAVSDLYSVSKPNKITFPVYCFVLATPNNRCDNYEVQLWLTIAFEEGKINNSFGGGRKTAVAMSTRVH